MEIGPVPTPTSRAGNYEPADDSGRDTAVVGVDGAVDAKTPRADLENAREGAKHFYNCSDADVLDMQRLGKHQEVKRRFGWKTTLGFASINMTTWEYVLLVLSTSLNNFGLAATFWTFIGTVICYTSVVLSLAEMASMAPTAAGQYSWISEFSSPWCQKILSYACGWWSSLSWIATTARSSFLAMFTDWQMTLSMIVVLSLSILMNNWWARGLSGLQVFALLAHIGEWIAMCIALLVSYSSHFSAPGEIFLHVLSHSWWPKWDWMCLASQVSVIYCNLGQDSVVHIAEEVKDASIVVPRCIVASYVSNVLLGTVTLIFMFFCISPLDAVTNSTKPHMRLFFDPCIPVPGIFLNMMLFFLVLLILLRNISALATATRQLWAFARDNGFPGCNTIKIINRSREVPVHAIWTATLLATTLCLIHLGGTIAFEAVTSISLIGILSTNILAIGSLVYRRISNSNSLPQARWSLGCLGLPINIIAICHCAFVLVFACFPTKLPLTPSTASWGPLVWVVVVLFTGLMYWAHGKKNYTPPANFILGSDSKSNTPKYEGDSRGSLESVGLGLGMG
ncbi:amino acid transporter [Lentithecium fluviatile CBS 122367]|uniref:Amino acid transporter n=1 Tax=Lentithecium fluviatile CBS 122367 TaxID=1168545 RepID=A0A6G1JL40_9PLEO|nr:amino acid transporter [Lentithecium fluviatile CBS 122367]